MAHRIHPALPTAASFGAFLRTERRPSGMRPTILAIGALGLVGNFVHQSVNHDGDPVVLQQKAAATASVLGPQVVRAIHQLKSQGAEGLDVTAGQEVDGQTAIHATTVTEDGPVTLYAAGTAGVDHKLGAGDSYIAVGINSAEGVNFSLTRQPTGEWAVNNAPLQANNLAPIQAQAGMALEHLTDTIPSTELRVNAPRY